MSLFFLTIIFFSFALRIRSNFVCENIPALPFLFASDGFLKTFPRMSVCPPTIVKVI